MVLQRGGAERRAYLYRPQTSLVPPREQEIQQWMAAGGNHRHYRWIPVTLKPLSEIGDVPQS